MTGTDPRFAAVATDPRFARFPKKHNKVAIDSRFKVCLKPARKAPRATRSCIAAVFEDEDFSVSSAATGKRGSKKQGTRSKKSGGNDEMRRYYHLTDDAVEDDKRAASAAQTGRQRGRGHKCAQDRTNQRSEQLAAETGEEDVPVEAPISHVAPQRARAERNPKQRQGSKQRDSSGKHTVFAEGGEELDHSDALSDRCQQHAVEPAPAADSNDIASPGRGDVNVSVDSSSESEDSDPGASPSRLRPDGGDEEARAEQRFLAMRGMGEAEDAVSSSGESSSEDGESIDGEGAAITIGKDDEFVLDPAEWGVGAAAGRPDADETLRMVDGATTRLAVIDLEWSRMRAVDIFAVLQSFVAGRGMLRDVTVYVSDYGASEMAQEKISGPRGLLRDDDEAASHGRGEAAEQAEAEQRLRMYERSKLRWHFAVATFDTAATANRVYEECDGHEFEESAICFDLRFVPDTETFTGRQVRDSATSIPADYAPPLFQSKALQHTKPMLTWDEGSADRKKLLQRKVTADELNEDDFKAYLASGSESSSGRGSESEDDGEVDDVAAIRARYATLVDDSAADSGTTGRKGASSWRAGGDNSLSASDALQVSFTRGLGALGRIGGEGQGAKSGKDLFQGYMRAKADSKKAQRAQGRIHVDSDTGSEDLGSPAEEHGRQGARKNRSALTKSLQGEGAFDDPFFQDDRDFDSGAESEDMATKQPKPSISGQTGTSESKRTSQSQKQQKHSVDADLDLLMMDDNALLAARDGAQAALLRSGHNNESVVKPRLTKKQRIALKKQQRRAAKERRDSDDEAVAADLEDPRFAAIASAEFAIDPADPHVSRIRDPKAMVEKVSKKRRQAAVLTKQARDQDVPALSGHQGSNLKQLVSSLKRKQAPQTHAARKTAQKAQK